MFLINPYILQASGGVIPTANLFAYSFRKVVSSATVSFRVRRSSDNAEQDIGFVGDDLDTTSLTTFVGANNGFVTKMYEQNGSGKDLAQTTASSQFQIVNAGSVYTLNGKPTCLTANAKSLVSSVLFNFETTIGVSVFSVNKQYVQLGGTYNIDFLYSLGDGTTSGRLLESKVKGSASNPTDFQQTIFNTSSTNISTIENTFTTGTKLQVNTINSTSHKYYENNILIGTNIFTPVNMANQKIYVNDDSFGNTQTSARQYFSEILVYNSYQDSNVNTINTNINNYYGIY